MEKELRLILYDREGGKCLPDPGWIHIDTKTKPHALASDVLMVGDTVMAELQDHEGNRLDIHLFYIGNNRWSFHGASSSPELAIWRAIATAKMRLGDGSMRAAGKWRKRTLASSKT